MCVLQEFFKTQKYTVHSTHTDLDAFFTDLKFVYFITEYPEEWQPSLIVNIILIILIIKVKMMN